MKEVDIVRVHHGSRGNKHTTAIEWTDGTKTIVSKSGGKDDEMEAFVWAVAKKLFGGEKQTIRKVEEYYSFKKNSPDEQLRILEKKRANIEKQIRESRKKVQRLKNSNSIKRSGRICINFDDTPRRPGCHILI